MATGQEPAETRAHTAAGLFGAKWERPYSREVGAFPLATLNQAKYWSPVGRVDHV